MRPARHAIRPRGAPTAALSPSEVTARLAIQAHKAGDLATAEKLYGQVLLQNPRHSHSLHNLGTIRLSREDTPAAVVLLEAAVQAETANPLFHSTLGNALQASGDFTRAEQTQRRALELKPDHIAAWEGLGITLRSMERFEESVAALQRVLQLDPASRTATRNLCNILMDVGDSQQAEELYRQLLERNPLDTDSWVPYGLLKLSRQDASGWSEYSRGHWSPEWLKLDPPVLVPLPQWDGEVLDQGLLLYGEQGIGDEIMFASLVTEAARRSPRTVLLCEPRLTALFARSIPGVLVAPRPRPGQPPLLHAETGCALRCSLSRLPAILDFTQRTGGDSYLRADAAAVSTWRQRLSELGPGLKIGLSWRGGASGPTRAMRSLQLDALAPLLDIPGTRFVNVQYGKHDDEIGTFNAGRTQPLINLDGVDPLHDMDGFAALLSALDLVISVDNSTVHLAGALGVNTWMLCPFNANWRWLRQGDSTHWYRSIQLFRQAGPDHAAWNPVIATMAAQLQHFTAPAHDTLPATENLAAPSIAAPRNLLAVRPDVMLINDTTYWSNWGSTATSLAIHENLRAEAHVVDSLAMASINRLGDVPADASQLDDERLFARFCQRHAGLIQRIQAVPEVILNGEDVLRDMSRPARAMLYLAWIARQRFGKRTSIINHSCSPAVASIAADEFHGRVYQRMDYIAVRDESSLEYLRKLHVEATPAFDCLPLFIAAHPQPQVASREKCIVLTGSDAMQPALVDVQVALAEQALAKGYGTKVLIGGTAFLSASDMQWAAALHARLQGRYTLVTATSERQWLSAIAGASLLVSARFHHCTAAACLGTPFMSAGDTGMTADLVGRLGLRRADVGITANDPATARRRMLALLENPQPAMVPESRLAELRELARRNFDVRARAAGAGNP